MTVKPVLPPSGWKTPGRSNPTRGSGAKGLRDTRILPPGQHPERYPTATRTGFSRNPDRRKAGGADRP